MMLPVAGEVSGVHPNPFAVVVATDVFVLRWNGGFIPITRSPTPMRSQPDMPWPRWL